MDLLYAAKTKAETIGSGSPISFDTMPRRRGDSVDLVGGSALLRKAGFYKVTATATIESKGASGIAVTMNSNKVFGGVGMTECDGLGEVFADCIVRVFPGEPESIVSVSVQGEEAKVENATIAVIRLD